MQSSFKDFESKRTPLTPSDTKKSGEGEIHFQHTQADTGIYRTYF